MSTDHIEDWKLTCLLFLTEHVQDKLLRHDAFKAVCEAQLGHPMGSSYVNGSIGHDVDVLLLGDPDRPLGPLLIEKGFLPEGGDYPADGFMSYRKGSINIVVVDCERRFIANVASALACRVTIERMRNDRDLGLDKDWRCLVHDTVETTVMELFK